VVSWGKDAWAPRARPSKLGRGTRNERFPDFKPATTYEDERRVFHVHMQAGDQDDVRATSEMRERLRREDEAVAHGGAQSGTP
jgi:hypothetical protein